MYIFEKVMRKCKLARLKMSVNLNPDSVNKQFVKIAWDIGVKLTKKFFLGLHWAARTTNGYPLSS